MFHVGPFTIEILEGDIAARRVDAIVNAANSALWMGSGVAGAIKRAGGPEIEADAMRQGPIDPGQAVITGAGRLPARHVIHAAAMGEDLRTDAALIRAATSAALDLARDHGLTSIAFPALGTGVGGFPVDRCARVMLETCRDHAEPAATSPQTLRTIAFVLFGAEAKDTFERVARDLFGAQS